ncbi:hypothetical protein FOL47_006669 [Perkinsus chesapeaki]|uniref:Saposin B-type domain-containing protein n=1 Tax=Perkinsus chesapeaki TaxID=330153 RepID=A0A7J6LQ68_PERCH|nr:hypothetical protein FOL47_006669 [Perkinsus chesapeaki]
MQLNLLLIVSIGVSAAYDTSAYLLAQKEIRDFVDSVANDVVKNMDVTEISEIESTSASRVLGGSVDQCSACILTNNLLLNNYFILKINQQCANTGSSSPYVKEFCETLSHKIHDMDQQLNGYLFQRLRIRQLSIAMCIGKEQCSQANAFNLLFNPALPDILTNIENYCPSVSFGNYEECIEYSSKDILDFATERVKAVCGPTVIKDHDLAEFCSYFSLNDDYGRGIVQGMVPVYQYSTFLCKQYSHDCRCHLAGGNPFA